MTSDVSLSVFQLSEFQRLSFSAQLLNFSTMPVRLGPPRLNSV
jgi:hypothetical protein